MRRVSVVGTSGAGKTTVARAVASALGVPHVELDALRHQAGWEQLPDAELEAQVAAHAAGDAWVMDGNYGIVRDRIVWPRADTVVWLDLPRRTVMRQIVTRSVVRVVRRTELWNGNRESWRDLVSRDPHRSVVLWAWLSHDRHRREYSAAARDPRWSGLRFVRVGSRREASELVASLRAGSPRHQGRRSLDRSTGRHQGRGRPTAGQG